MSQLCPTCRLPIPDDAETCPHDGTPLHLDPTVVRDALLGQMVGEYEIEERIGTGGMGIVYRAVQPMIGKKVAIKILRPEVAADPEHMKRFLEEARAVSQIHHRGIIDVYGFGRLPDGRQYVVMEHLDGRTLEEVISRGDGVSVEDALVILDEILSALGAAHAAGVIHRDLKPSNIFCVHQTDGSLNVKLLDFGLAKRSDPGGSAAQSRISLMVGTPEFMAPEQARGEPVGPATDLYAVGVIAFELFTGKLPFTGATPIEIVLQHLDKPPPLPSSVSPRVPAPLDGFVLSLLAKMPKDRPSSAEVVRQALRRLTLPGIASLPPMLVTGQIPLTRSKPPAESPSTNELARTFLSRRPRTWAIGSLGACVLALALFWAARSELAPVISPHAEQPKTATVAPAIPSGTRSPGEVSTAATPGSTGPAVAQNPSQVSGQTAAQNPTGASGPGTALQNGGGTGAPATGVQQAASTEPKADRSSDHRASPQKLATHADARVATVPVSGGQHASRRDAIARRRRARIEAPTRESLLAELGRLEHALAAQTPSGQQPDPVAAVYLSQQRRELDRARTPSDFRRIAEVLADWPTKFLKRR